MKKFNPDPDRTLIGSDTDPGKTIRIGIPAKNKNKIKSLLVGTGTYFLFSMVFVGSVFDTDPDSGSSPTFDTYPYPYQEKLYGSGGSGSDLAFNTDIKP